MDPLHITEFASDQYFQKLTQERQQQLHRQQQETDAQGLVASPAAPLPLPSQSKFILPLRDSKTAEVDEAQAQPTEQKQKKSRFGGFSRLLHSSKSQQPQPADPPARPVISAPIPLTESFERLSVGEYVKSKRFVTSGDPAMGWWALANEMDAAPRLTNCSLDFPPNSKYRSSPHCRCPTSLASDWRQEHGTRWSP